MDMAYINGQTEVGIKANGRRIRCQGMAYINRKTALHMMAIGAKVVCRAKAYTKLQTDAYMMVAMPMIRRKDMEYKLIPTVKFIKDNGIKERNMEREYKSMQMALAEPANGSTGN